MNSYTYLTLRDRPELISTAKFLDEASGNR